jgi:hypothetical protein
MSPNTRPNNKDKHPGIVDLSPPRRTQAHKRADDEKTPEEKQAQEEARQAGIRHLAEVEKRTMQKLKSLMGPGPGPRAVSQKGPGGLVTASSTSASSTPSSTATLVRKGKHIIQPVIQ